MPDVVARYDYVDEEGSLLFQVERLRLANGSKGFRQRRPVGDGEWAYNLEGVRRVLYRLPEVAEAVREGRPVFVVEGEKDADNLRERGVCATTAPMGAGKWLPEHTAALRGARKVLVLADNDPDDKGRRHALQVACALDGQVGELRVFTPAAGMRDITEHLEAGLGSRELVPFDWRAERAREQRGRSIRVMALADFMALPGPDESDNLLGPLIRRGARLVVGAHTGQGKTSWGLQALSAILRAEDFLGWRGSGNGARALIVDVEQGRGTTQRRVDESGLREVQEKADIIWEPDGLALDRDERQRDQVEEALKAGGYDVVLADPLYKLHQGDSNDEAKVVELMRLFDRWRLRFGFALLLPMHCRKPVAGQSGKMTIHDIIGSGAHTRGAEVVVGLQMKNPGFSHLYFFKDREGDLGCLNERWGLLFDRAAGGFRRDPRDGRDEPLRVSVRSALEERPGMTIDEIRQEVGAGHGRVRSVLDSLGAVHDGAPRVAEKRWRVPDALFGYDQEARPEGGAV